jgi:nitrite reductase/ring-hydroxylating ferredoxin subunit
VLVPHADRLYALVETCAHLGGPLADAKLEGNAVVCP